MLTLWPLRSIVLSIFPDLILDWGSEIGGSFIDPDFLRVQDTPATSILAVL